MYNVKLWTAVIIINKMNYFNNTVQGERDGLIMIIVGFKVDNILLYNWYKRHCLKLPIRQYTVLDTAEL